MITTLTLNISNMKLQLEASLSVKEESIKLKRQEKELLEQIESLTKELQQSKPKK